MPISEKVTHFISEAHPKRFPKALDYLSRVQNVTVTREDGLDISGVVKSELEDYGPYWGPEGYYCNCIDQTSRKVVCKHLLALLLMAVYEEKIFEVEMMGLLLEASKEEG